MQARKSVTQNAEIGDKRLLVISVRVPRKLWKDVKLAAVRRDTNVQAVVAVALQAWMAGKSRVSGEVANVA